MENVEKTTIYANTTRKSNVAPADNRQKRSPVEDRERIRLFFCALKIIVSRIEVVYFIP